MAHILYGLSGDGSGHSSRAKIIIEHLQARGHKVKVVSYDRGYENLHRFFDVEKIAGLNMAYRGNSVHYLETAVRNMGRLHKMSASLVRLLSLTEKFQPQIFFTDFEPLTALIAHFKHLPLISIDNQHIMTNSRLNIPTGYRKEAFVARQVIRSWIRNADAFLITSFFEPPIIKKNTFIMPPILRQEVLDAIPETGDHYLIYSTSKCDSVLCLLENFPARFVVYGLGVTCAHGKSENITLKKTDSRTFLEDLRTCRGVIATAGFSLISEALHLGKPYLAMPVKKQFEQTANAFYLQKLGYGLWATQIHKKDLETFLANLPQYEVNLRRYRRQDNHLLFRKIDQLIKNFLI